MNDYGPAMDALNERQREFVLALLQQVGIRPNYTKAAKAAGYSAESYGSLRGCAFHLARNTKVLAAIREEMGKRIQLGGMVGVYGLQAIAGDPSHKDHLKACIALADRGGYLPEQKINVNHNVTDRTGAAMTERIMELAKKFGLDPAAFLGQQPQMKVIEHVRDQGEIEETAGAGGVEAMASTAGSPPGRDVPG